MQMTRLITTGIETNTFILYADAANGGKGGKSGVDKVDGGAINNGVGEINGGAINSGAGSAAVRDAVIIDPGGGYEKIKEFLDSNKLKAVAVLLTHGHFDHSGQAVYFQREGVPVYIHKNDFALAKLNERYRYAARWGVVNVTADVFVEDGEVLNIAGIKIKAMHTAGHTAGSVSFFVGDKIFCGDTLFYHDIGRTDLNGGSMEDMLKTIEKFKALNGDYTIYPGHGEFTTLSEEKLNNPYFK
jgi:glyoxylase-like metal-dependent hydrolase (beta-lactamase superfamily II)